MNDDETVISRNKRDRQLVAKARSGDTNAFDELVTAYRGKVYAMIYSMMRNEQDAWDISQEGFVKAWKSLKQFNEKSSFFTWLYRIMTNLAIDCIRKRARRPESEFDETFIQPSEAATGAKGDPSDAAFQQEIGKRIESAIGELSADHRAVVVMREVEGMQYQEIADILECSIGTVMSRLFYARKCLQNSLGDLYEKL